MGADVRFFDDRLGLDVTYYDALTTNQILSVPIALATGYSERVINGGSIRSRGMEAIVTYVPLSDQATFAGT